MKSSPIGANWRYRSGIVKKHGAKYGFIDSAELNTAYGSDVTRACLVDPTGGICSVFDSLGSL